MPQIIKIRCNGEGKHMHEFAINDLKKIIGNTVTAYRGDKYHNQPTGSHPIPERIVLPCKHCTDGKVIITREMIERVFQNKA